MNCRTCGFTDTDCDLIGEYQTAQSHQRVCKGYTDRQLLKRLKRERDDKTQVTMPLDKPKQQR